MEFSALTWIFITINDFKYYYYHVNSRYLIISTFLSYSTWTQLQYLNRLTLRPQDNDFVNKKGAWKGHWL